MKAKEITFKSKDNLDIILFEWECNSPKAIVHIIHGMSEHSSRYNHFANWLNSKNIFVISSDLRGHGKTAGNIDNIGFFANNNGWKIVTEDIVNVSEHYKNLHSKIPLIILGHSMGSFLARTIAIDYPNTASGYIFSATAGHPGLLGILGNKLAKLNGSFFGKKNRSKLLDFLAFGDFNKRIKNNSTKKDWLTNDKEIVEKYINDPYCMQIFTSQFFVDLTSGLLKINDTSEIQKMNKKTPYLLFSGTMDPVGNYGKGVNEVVDKLKRLDFSNVTCKLFNDGRHEMLNETNKEEVYEFIYHWINKNISN